jgi:succinoglycan biosynthesis protein ExoM
LVQPTSRHAAICVATYLRPTGLARLLEAIGRLEIPDGWAFDVVVVDNDSAGSARAVVEAARGLEVRYVVEAERGIAQVRNRAVRESKPSAFIAFIDDDEWPESGWWRQMVEAQSRSGADVTIGPSEPVFELEPPDWIREGRFFERARFPTGTVVPHWVARTSGVLIRRSALEHLGDNPFDERFSLNGGDDTWFFKMLDRAGSKVVWVDDAIVYELVPATRATARWLLRRAFRTGNSRGYMLRLDTAGVLMRAKGIGRGVKDIGIGIGRTIGAQTKAGRMQGVANSALGVGLIVGSLGVRYDEYTKIHGR